MGGLRRLRVTTQVESTVIGTATFPRIGPVNRVAKRPASARWASSEPSRGNTSLGSYESPISASDAHTAMEYYLFAPSADTLSELSSLSLTHLYFVKAQVKPAGYDGMDTNKKQRWNRSRMQTI